MRPNPIHLGNVPAGSTLYIPFSTYDVTNGASVTISNFAVGDINIYKNGSTTQRSSTNGFTLLDTDGIDFDGLTGIHGFSIDLSDNSDAGFYSVGGFYWVVVSPITVSTQTVGLIAATFRIVTAESVTGQPKVDIAAFGGTAGTFASGIPSANVASGGIASTAFASGAITAAAIAADAIGASELAADAVTEIQSGLSTLTAATVRSAVGLASANLDTQLAAVPTANQNADALLDRTAGIETGLTLRQCLRLMASVLFGKASGLETTTVVYRDVNDSANRITATVDDSGNRTSVTLNAS